MQKLLAWREGGRKGGREGGREGGKDTVENINNCSQTLSPISTIFPPSLPPSLLTVLPAAEPQAVVAGLGVPKLLRGREGRRKGRRKGDDSGGGGEHEVGR